MASFGLLTAISYTFWTVFHQFGVGGISHLTYASFYEKLADSAAKGGDKGAKAAKTQTQWRYFVTMALHALIAGPASAYVCLFDPIIARNPIRGTSMSWQALSALSSGFFLWDFIECSLNRKVHGTLMQIHGAFCLALFIVCGISADTPLAWYASAFLMFELSTPFMVKRWISIVTGANKRIVRNDLLTFAVVFVVVRFVWGVGYAAPTTLALLVRPPEGVQAWKVFSFWVMFLMSNGLNVYWLYRLSLRVFFPKPEKKKPQ